MLFPRSSFNLVQTLLLFEASLFQQTEPVLPEYNPSLKTAEIVQDSNAASLLLSEAKPMSPEYL